MFTALQSMVNQGEFDGLELLQGYVDDLKSYNTAKNNHEEQNGSSENTKISNNVQKTDPKLIPPFSWDQYDETNVDDLIDELMEEKTGQYDGKMPYVLQIMLHTVCSIPYALSMHKFLK